MSSFRPVPLLWRATAVVVALHVGAIVVERLLDVSRRTGLLRQVDLNAEANATAWFGSFLLLVAAALAVASATSAPVVAAGAARRRFVLAALLALMSVDETAQLHDLATGPLRAALDTELTAFHFAWVIPGLVVVVAAGLYLAPLSRTLEGREAPRLLAAAAVYVTGAVVLEMAGGLVVDVDVTVNGYTLPYLAVTTFEESLELVGAVLLVSVLLDVARRLRPDLTGADVRAEDVRALSDRRHSIVISPYDPGWPEEFAAIAELLRGTLGDIAVSVDHIGSTAVPGLAAKDVIDVQVSVLDLSDPRLTERFAALGAADLDIRTDHVPPGQTVDPAEWEKRMFRAPDAWRRTHLHVRQVGRANHRYALLFRDYLRASPPAAAAYERVKVALARLHPDDVEAYYDVKDPVCDLVIQAAELWQGSDR